MLTSRRLGSAALLFAALFTMGCGSEGPKGDKGDPGATGATGDKGDPGTSGNDGTDAVTVGDVSGTVTDGTNPIQGVAVSVSPGTATATSDASGKFDLKGLDIGAYVMKLSATGYLDQSIVVTVTAKGTTTVSVSLAKDTSTQVPPVVTMVDNPTAGFNKPVSIQATASGTGPFTYEWKQTSGPTVTLSGANTDTVGFTTIDFVTAKGPAAIENARFGVIGVNPDQAGNYVFEVTVTDANGLSTKADVSVNATRPTAGLRMVPIGIPVWLQGDGVLAASTVTGATAAQTTWNWTLDKSGAAGSTATLSGGTTQFPSFTPDVKGIYKLTESVANKTMTIYAGTWQGEMTADGSAPSASCGLCHTGNLAPATFDEWKGTRHFKGLADKLDGVTTQHFTEECMSCHTVGYDKTASNGGFDDIEGASGWTFPATLKAGNWTTLVSNTTLGPLAGIQCENCHGPQTQPTGGPHTSSQGANNDVAARISWSSDVCASCHQEEPYHYKPAQWNESGHANRELALGEGTAEKNASNLGHCGRCHAAQGFARYAGQLNQKYYAYLTSDGKPLDTSPTPTNHKATSVELSAIGMNVAQVESQTCQTCHDPHNATNPSQLRIYDSVKMLPSGLDNVSGMGAGMICATCHNSRNGEHTDFAQNTTDTNGNFVAVGQLFTFSGVHSAAQSDMVFGFNAYFMPRINPSAHLAVKDSCAGCHYGVATDGMTKAGEAKNHSFRVDNTICAACHTENVNGDALQAANQIQLDSLLTLLAGRTKTTINAAINYVPPTGTMDVLVRAYDPVSDSYSTSSSTITPTTAGLVSLCQGPNGLNPPTSIGFEFAKNGTTPLLVLNLAKSVTFQPTATGAAPVTTNALRVSIERGLGMITNQQVSGGSATYWPPASTYYSPLSAPGPKTSGTPAIIGTYPALPNPPPWVNAANVQVLYKAYWNWYLLRFDNTKGIHNPTFFNDVVGKTSAALMALP